MTRDPYFVGCVTGAMPIENYRSMLVDAGFAQVEVIDSGRDLDAYTKGREPSGVLLAPGIKPAHRGGRLLLDLG